MLLALGLTLILLPGVHQHDIHDLDRVKMVPAEPGHRRQDHVNGMLPILYPVVQRH